MHHIAISGLLSDIAGAVLLARALAFGSARDYVAGTESGFGQDLAAADLSRARDMSDALIGTVLLVAGFVGQAVATTWSDSASAGLWPYAFLGGEFVAAALALLWIRRWRARQIVEARLFARLNGWAIAVDDYELGMGREPGKHKRGDLLAALLGKSWWDDLIGRVERARVDYEAAIQRGEGAITEHPNA